MFQQQQYVPRQLVVFPVGPTCYALDVDDVEGILPPSDIIPLRGAPGGVLGLMEVADRLAPVFDLHWKFGVAQPVDWDSQRLILIRSDDGPVALMVDRIEEFATVPRESFQQVSPPGSSHGLGYLRGVFHHRSRLVLWVDPMLLLPTGAVAAAVA